MAAAPEAGQGGCAGHDCDDSASDDGGASPAAAPSPAALVEAPECFTYWADEILWSQGKVAVELIEEALESMGGRRVGGPPKAARDKPAAPDASEIAAANTDSERPPEDSDAAAAPAPAAAGGGARGGIGVVAAMAARLGISGARGGRGPAGAGGGGAAALSGAPGVRADEDQLGYCHVPEWQFLWTKSVYGIKAARSMRPGQVVSAVAGLNSLTMKKRMIATLKSALGLDLACQVAPVSFCLPEELGEWRQWLQDNPERDTGLWMLKTGQDAGKGLRLVPTGSALQLASQAPRSPDRPHTHLKVAQLYVTDPLLLLGRKFHLRLWVLVTGHAPLRAYMHTRGLVLFSSHDYEPGCPVASGVRPSASHVTNYARNEDTWVWGLDRLQRHMEEHLGRRGDAAAWAALWREMRRRAALGVAAALPSLRAAHAWLRPPVRNYGFQMVGLDFLLDEAMVPWLLEFNSAPSIMAVHSDPAVRAVIHDNKAEMLRDVTAMVLPRVAAGGGDVADGAWGGAARRARQERRAGAAASGGGASGWRRDLEGEMSNRGGFEPLMAAFPYDHPGVPWQEEDSQLQQMWRERGWPWIA